MSQIDRYPRRYCSICHRVVPRTFKPGPGGRPNASCPKCRSLERHRFFAVLLATLGPILDEVDTVLEVAPSPETSPILAGLGAKRHVRLDLGADNRLVDVLGSITDVPLADDSVDLLVCYHVLEHVPDDAAAMREIARVLRPTGMALLQVPIRWGTTTDEDPSAPEEERVRRFGQADHVRYYGDDFEDRLVDAGLSIQRVTPRSILGDAMSTWLHLMPAETVWIARPSSGARVPDRVAATGHTPLTRTFDGLLDELQVMRERLRGSRREVKQLQAQVARLRSRSGPAHEAGIRESSRALAGAVRRRLR